MNWSNLFFPVNFSRLTAVGSFSRSFLHPSCRKTSGQSAVSGRQWMSCVCRVPAQRWPRLSGPPGATWSKRSRSKAEGATSWTLASGGTCSEKTPCKVRLDLRPSSGQASVPANVLLSSVLVSGGHQPGPSSVMDLLRPEDRQRLLNFRNSSAQPDASAAGKATPATAAAVLPPQSSPAPAVSTGLQQEALAVWRDSKSSSQTFRPFEKEPSKQARYELYLSRLKQGDRGSGAPSHHALHLQKHLQCILRGRNLETEAKQLLWYFMKGKYSL